MSRTLLRIAMREQRRGLLGFAWLGAVMVLVQAVGFARIAGDTAAARRAFAGSMTVISKQFSWLYPDPVRIDTLGGYLQWRVFSFAAVLLGVWAVFLGAGAVRRGEDRGLLDQCLAAGVPRVRLVAVRAVAGAGALAAVVVVMCLAAVLGAAAAGEGVDAGGLAGIGLSLWAATCVCLGLALLLSQVVRGRRTALGAGTALVVGLFLLQGFSRQIEGLRGVALVSPFHWYDRASALAPGAGYDAGGVAGMLLVAAVLVALSAAALRRRDTGAALLRVCPRARAAVLAPSRNPALRLPVLSRLWQQRWSLLAWCAGTAVGAVFVAAVAKPAADLLDRTPELRRVLPSVSHGATTVQLYVGFAWFGLAALITAAYAVTAAARWSSDDVEGRLGAELSAPVSRPHVAVERGAEALAGLLLLAAVDAAAVLAGTAGFGLGLDAGAVLLSCALLVPLGLVFAAAGAVLSAVRPRAAVFVLSGVAVASYLLSTLGPLFRLPAWALDLSVFQLYGNPLVDGLFVTGLVALLATAAAGEAVSVVALSRREVGG